MKNCAFIVVVLLACFALPGRAEPPKLPDFPPPRAPFVGPPPKMADWTISVQPAPVKDDNKQKETPPPRSGVVKIHSVKTGALKQDIVSYTSGQSCEIWYYNDYVLTSSVSNPGRIIVQTIAALNDPGDAKGTFREVGSTTKSLGYPGFNWLQFRYYKGVTLFGKTTPCYYYVLPGKDPDSGKDLIVAEAWVNAQTNAPVAYTEDGQIYTFSFGEAPTAQLSMPSAFTAAYAKLQQNLTRQQRLEADAASLRR